MINSCAARAMIIDLHNHTIISSPCSYLEPELLIKTAKKKGLNGLCVTEHLTIHGATMCRELGYKMNFLVFRGIEARTDLGDMLVYGYYEDIPEFMPLHRVCELVHAKGGVVFAAHPFHTRGGANLYESLKSRGIDLLHEWYKVEVLFHLDGIEILNGQVRDEDNALAKQLQLNLGIKGIGGSDAHSVERVGRAATVFSREISCDEDLVEALKSDDYEVVQLG
ncbi:MAG: PHP domain-containing protein [Spirochaetales bacterium]|nr:PHP domain-containing protein [Spirochaetales bacterium]